MDKIINYKNIHFIGIGGVSMSGLAQILNHNKNFNISGSDLVESTLTNKLKQQGIKVFIGQNPSNINKDLDLVVYTAAVKKDNPELKQALKLGIKTMERAEFLGHLMLQYKTPICIAGTHGKTTTTSMVSEIFMYDDKNPTISIGGVLSSINSNTLVGGEDFFILETCEYCDSFLHFSPHSAIILNIEQDHLDYFSDLDHIYSSFTKFSQLIPEDGLLVINSDIEHYLKIVNQLNCNVVTYGKDGQWQARDIVFNENSVSYTAIYNNLEFIKIKLNVTGLHNVYNSLAACALAHFYGISKKNIQEGLLNFKGTARRFELKGYFKEATIIDDYAHHPTEILATLDTARKYNINKLVCVFQPHTFTRTKAFLKEFAKSFNDADKVIVLDIYAAREIDNGDIHSKDLVKEINNLSKDKAIYLKNFEEAKLYLSTILQKGDMLITIGAGNINLLAEMIKDK